MCFDCGSYYVDLVDGWDFVVGIMCFDVVVWSVGCLVVSGVFSVLVFSSVVVDVWMLCFVWLDRIESVISFGNCMLCGDVMVVFIFGYCGWLICVWCDVCW